MSFGQSFRAITPSDSVDLVRNAAGEFPASIYAGVAGNISVVGADGESAVFQNVPAGYPLPIRARRINATGTTATGLIGIYV